MQKTFRSKMKKIMEYNMLQKEQEFPGNLGEFESFEELMDEFEAE